MKKSRESPALFCIKRVTRAKKADILAIEIILERVGRMYCKRCGSYLDERASQCPVCGEAVCREDDRYANTQAINGSAQPEWQQMPCVNSEPLQTERPVKVTEWMLTMVISGIPIINIIMLFVWAFGSRVPTSKRNWARAILIFGAITVTLYIVAFILFMVLAGRSHSTAEVWHR